MRLANGFGSVTKLKGNRRKPYMVREGKTGKQRLITCTATYEEGMAILLGVNGSFREKEITSFTFQELLEKFLEERGKKLGQSSFRALTSVVRYCSYLVDFDYQDIKAYDMQKCIDECGHGYATQNAIKNLFHHLDRFAVELDVCKNKFSEILTTETQPETRKIVFSQEEIETLWKNQNVAWVDSILIFLYTGLRISELLEIKKQNIDLEVGTITGGKKTKSGKNRVIPIHSKILPLIKRRMEKEGEYLISYKGQGTSESNYRKNWNKLMARFDMKHTPHECRHTFRSLLDSAGANKVCIDRMMGHKSVGTGEQVYTHKTVPELRKNLELVTA